MADNELDKYLSDLGIDTADESASVPAPRLPGEAPEPVAERSAGAGDPDAEREEVRRRVELQTPPAVSDGLAERCAAFLVAVLLNLGPAYAAEVREVDGGLQADIYGGDAGKIIGRGGRTLAALEYLTNAVINRDERAPQVRVSVDVGGYKERRDERLRGVALKAAARARKTGFAVELEPMSAAERRVIHMALAEHEAVESESFGEGKNRRVVVKPL